MILRDKENPFENPSKSDAKEAYECLLLDPDKEDDKGIDIFLITCRLAYSIF